MRRLMKYGVLASLPLILCVCGCNEGNKTNQDVSEIVDDEVQTGYQTYEFETFDGETIVIDEQNIMSQEKVDNVLETSLVPADAQIIAPGRDYVYLEDAEYIYVEDALKGLLTKAIKPAQEADMNTEADMDSQIEADSVGTYDIEEYIAPEYSLSYDADSFEVFEDETTDSVTFSYCKENVEMAGSNVITFYVVRDVDAKSLIEEKTEAAGKDKSDIMEVYLNDTDNMSYCFTYGGESNDSGLNVVSTYYAVPCGSDTIFIDGFRTVGPDDAVEMTIDSGFEYIMQTLTVNK